MVQVVTALVILAVFGVAGLILRARQGRRRAERARQDRIRAVLSGWMPDHPTVAELQHRIEREHHDEDHYGRHALDPDRVATGTGDISVQRQCAANTMRLLSGETFVPMAGPHYGNTA